MTILKTEQQLGCFQGDYFEGAKLISKYVYKAASLNYCPYLKATFKGVKINVI